MKAVCLTTVRFNMVADILRQASNVDNPADPTEFGHWEDSQDPLTGDIIRIWVVDNPNTPEVETTYETLRCMARGIISKGASALGNTQEWSEIYRDTELINLSFPSNKILTKRDRVLNIRNQWGQILWKEEETGVQGVYKATVFEVLGVTPIVGPFGEHIENYAMLERAEVQ